jgi:hypothetical protein
MATLKLKNGWKPISTAPDDRRIVCWNPVTGQWMTKKEGNAYPMHGWNGAAGVWYPEPVYWRELEADPK